MRDHCSIRPDSYPYLKLGAPGTPVYHWTGIVISQRVTQLHALMVTA